MDNQHKHIKGYRDLSADEIARMNECKELAEQVGDLINRLELIEDIDDRALEIAKTNLQTGFMWAVRSIAQPSTF